MRSSRLVWYAVLAAGLGIPATAPARLAPQLIPPHARAILLAHAAPSELRVVRALEPLEVSDEVPARTEAFTLPKGSQVTPATEWVIATDVTITVLRAPPGSMAMLSGAINARAALGLVVDRTQGALRLTQSALAGEASTLQPGRPLTAELLNCPQFGSLRGAGNTVLLSLSVQRGMRLRIRTSRIVLVRVPAKVCGQ